MNTKQWICGQVRETISISEEFANLYNIVNNIYGPKTSGRREWRKHIRHFERSQQMPYLKADNYIEACNFMFDFMGEDIPLNDKYYMQDTCRVIARDACDIIA